ncbi:MAG TPA: type II toxin-antitoxin system VapC family toxin [Terriglobia bacterium]|nr:type II toxin-antitoxin system VapC family toxin [Terriglobia bacterium]
MITAVDSSVLLDILVADTSFGPASAHAVRTVLAEDRLIACEVVWAEVAGSFLSATAARQALDRLNLEFSPLTVESALEAGIAWRSYRARGGGPRRRVVADFLIGAHALRQADRLLTRDRGFYCTYFKHLSLLDPSKDR